MLLECHPERSEAESRDRYCEALPQQTSFDSAAQRGFAQEDTIFELVRFK